MPKAEKGSIKDIGKRIKAKGLQKLKFYCQLCEKQCRDANGFKCHLTSDSHLRQMKLFSENAKGFMDSYSREFEQMYLDTLRRRHGVSRTNANNVYQEVIQDRKHVHMNATMWATLTDFCKYLGKKGKCVVEETERGWYITYIEQDATKLAREERLQQRLAADERAERANQERMEKQRVQAAAAFCRATGAGNVQQAATKLDRNNREGEDSSSNNNNNIQLSLSLQQQITKKKAVSASTSLTSKKRKSVFGDDDDDSSVEENNEREEGPTSAQAQVPPPTLPASKTPSSAATSFSSSKKQQRQRNTNDHERTTSSFPEKRPKPEQRQQHQNDNGKQQTSQDSNDHHDKDCWLLEGILVRIIDETLANGKYFRRKAVVDRVIYPKKKKKKYSAVLAEVTVLDENKNSNGNDNKDAGGGDVLRLDQRDLETVIPKQQQEQRHTTGSHPKPIVVKIVEPGSKYRGKRATILQLDKKRYKATLQLKSSSSNNKYGGTILKGVDFEHFSQRA